MTTTDESTSGSSATTNTSSPATTAVSSYDAAESSDLFNIHTGWVDPTTTVFDMTPNTPAVGNNNNDDAPLPTTPANVPSAMPATLPTTGFRIRETIMTENEPVIKAENGPDVGQMTEDHAQTTTTVAANPGYNKAVRKRSDAKRSDKRQRADLRKKIHGNWENMKMGRQPSKGKKTTRYHKSNLGLANIIRLQTNLYRRAEQIPKESGFLKKAAKSWPKMAMDTKGDVKLTRSIEGYMRAAGERTQKLNDQKGQVNFLLEDDDEDSDLEDYPFLVADDVNDELKGKKGDDYDDDAPASSALMDLTVGY